jgi:hypothetical protein
MQMADNEKYLEELYDFLNKPEEPPADVQTVGSADVCEVKEEENAQGEIFLQEDWFHDPLGGQDDVLFAAVSSSGVNDVAGGDFAGARREKRRRKKWAKVRRAVKRSDEK